jgi:translation initiation factor 3 subunit G
VQKGFQPPLHAPPPAYACRKVIGPDKHGIKTIIEFKVKEDGTKARCEAPPLRSRLTRVRPQVKVTKKLRVQKVTKRVSKAVLERRQWRKFGGSEKLKPGESDQGVRRALHFSRPPPVLMRDLQVTAVSVEEIFLERVRVQSKSEVEKLTDPLAAMAASNTSLLVCRICGKKGDHWTSKCPYKDLAASKGLTVGEKLDESGSGDARKGGGYVPPSMRSGAKGGESMGDSMRKPRDENSIRVTNLSEDTREQDLQELFRPFGPVTRIYVAFNRETGESRGFAFVNFVNRDDAQRAINKLDG